MSDLIDEQCGYIDDYDCNNYKDNIEKQKRKNECKQTDYFDDYNKIQDFVISEQKRLNYGDRWSRSKFCDLRNELHATRAKKFKAEKEILISKITTKQCVVACKCCGAAFVAKNADRKRGWGKFCSKSCKAQRQ